jgi:hypothetical protein
MIDSFVETGDKIKSQDEKNSREDQIAWLI